MRKIVFYYPSRTIGGAQLLFIRLADYISKNTNSEIYYVDYKDGFSKTYIKNDLIKYIDYDDNKSIRIPNDSCVIIPANFIFRINKLFTYNKDSFFLIWSIHPSNILSWLIDIKSKTFLSKSKKEKIGSLIVNLYNTGYLQFMDYTNYISNALFFNFSIFDMKYLQIPVEDENFENREIVTLNDSKLNIAWLGRLDKDKINSLKILINEIEQVSLQLPIKLYIIGVGSEYEDLKNFVRNYHYEIDFVGKLYGKELDDFLRSKVHIGAAMGTSALEIANKGKPVIMIDIYDNVYKACQMKYNLIHQIKDYSLGSIYPFRDNEKREYLFKDAINLILTDYKFYAKKSFQYVNENHSIKVVSELLIKIIEKNDKKDFTAFYDLINELESIYISHKNSFSVRFYRYLKNQY